MPELTDEPRETRDADLIRGNKLLGEAQYGTVQYVRNHFASVIDKSHNEHAKILITEHKRPAAAVVPVSELRISMLLEKIGITDELSELTYRDITIEEAIDTLIQMTKDAKSRLIQEDVENRGHHEDESASSERERQDNPPQPRAA